MNASFTIDDQPHVLHEADSLETQNTKVVTAAQKYI